MTTKGTGQNWSLLRHGLFGGVQDYGVGHFWDLNMVVLVEEWSHHRVAFGRSFTVMYFFVITDQEQQTRQALNCPAYMQDSPFCLLLKDSQGIRLGPKATLDIPISFAPEDTKRFEALCVVCVRKEDGTSWHYVPSNEKG